ncbi:MAG TPA: hypothetical protein VFF02_15715 [Anaeromyxobacteraceae bacterium]|nr:hypothetical protein [Anaeromyxobacteraceae bacterium]
MQARLALLTLLAAAAGPGQCGGPPPDAGYDACAGKACGQECVIEPPCRAATPPCMAPSILGRCDGAGLCLAGDAVACRPVADCAGQPCGVPCDTCGGMCMHPYATACDLWGQCVPASSWICWDPCAGKACGADCHLCPADAADCAEAMVAKACDPTGRCVARTPALVCPP